MFNFSNNNNEIMITVTNEAIVFMNFCDRTGLLNIFSFTSNIINPNIPPNMFVMMSEMSKASTLKIN